MHRRDVLRWLALLPGAALLKGCTCHRGVIPPVPVLQSITPPPLYPSVSADPRTFAALIHLQLHTEWVSQPAAQVPALLEAAGFTLIDGVIDPDGTGGQAYVAEREQDVVVAFRGSGSDTSFGTFENILADSDVLRLSPVELLADPGDARVHGGFYQNYLRFRESVHARLARAPGKTVYVTGFSLGSALACFCAFDVAVNLGRMPTAHMLGTPRTGNAAWRALWEARVSNGLRVTLESDPISRVPLQVDERSGFDHLSDLLVLNFDGSPVQRSEIDGNLAQIHKEEETFSAHNRDRYAAAIRAFNAAFSQQPALLMASPDQDPLGQAAEAEAQSVRHL